MLSYFTRYQSTKNPDFGASFPQIATIHDQPGIDLPMGQQRQREGRHRPGRRVPLPLDRAGGGSSLYDQFVPFVASREVLRIVSSIYATEAVHYAIFRAYSVTAFRSGDGKLVVPDLTEGKHGSAHVMPKRRQLLPRQEPADLPVILPSSAGQGRGAGGGRVPDRPEPVRRASYGFFKALTALAKAADGVG